MEPGIYELSNHDYHAGPGLSCSSFKEFLRSPAHYQHYLTEKRVPTPAMVVGTAIHTAILEPDKFQDEVVVEPEFAPKKPSKTQREAKKPSPETVEAIKFWDDFQAKATGKTVISHDDYENVMGMLTGAMRCEPAVNLLKTGFPELSVYANDPEHGFLWKARPDWLTPAGAVVDVKKCQDASPKAFQRQIVNYRYHIQAALYLQVLTWATGKKHELFYFLAVEERPPHCAAAYQIDFRSVSYASLEIDKGRKRFAECLESNVWPGYSNKILPTGIPEWAAASDGNFEE